jgi:selenocysteine lyase/cysteine desulfurase
MRRLGLDPEEGVVRASLVHYNTLAEIHRLGEVLGALRRGRAPSRTESDARGPGRRN